MRENNPFSTVISIVFFISLPLYVNAAEVHIVRDDDYNAPVVMIDGEISKGDVEKVKDVFFDLLFHKDYRYSHFYINSSGGDAIEAMKIGRFLRDMLIKIMTVNYRYYDPDSKDGIEAAEWYKNNPEEAYAKKFDKFIKLGEPIPDEYIGKCYSACVLIFYAGARRDSTDNGYFRDSKNRIPVIGLHRPYFDQEYFSQLSPVDAKKEYLKLESNVRNYMEEMGAPNELIERMFKTSSNNIELLLHSEFKQYYERKAPFFEEWLLAKCGAKILLTEEELKYFKYINGARANEAKKYAHKKTAEDTYKYFEILIGYFPYGADEELYNNLANKVQGCRTKVVNKHQLQWAIKNYKN